MSVAQTAISQRFAGAGVGPYQITEFDVADPSTVTGEHFPDGVADGTTLVNGVDFTARIEEDGSVFVDTTSAYVAADTLVFSRWTPRTQDRIFSEVETPPGKEVEGGLDDVVRMLQETEGGAAPPPGTGNPIEYTVVTSDAGLSGLVPNALGVFAYNSTTRSWYISVGTTAGDWAKLAQAPSTVFDEPVVAGDWTHGAVITAGEYWRFTDPRTGLANIWKAELNMVGNDGAAGGGGTKWNGVGDNRPGVWDITVHADAPLAEYLEGDEDWRNLAQADLGGGYTGPLWTPWYQVGKHFHVVESWPGEPLNSGRRILWGQPDVLEDWTFILYWMLEANSEYYPTPALNTRGEWRKSVEGLDWVFQNSGTYRLSREFKMNRHSQVLSVDRWRHRGGSCIFRPVSGMTDWIDKAMFRVAARDDKPDNDPGRVPEGSSNFSTVFGGFHVIMSADDDTNALMDYGVFCYLSHNSLVYPIQFEDVAKAEADGKVVAFGTGYLCDDWRVIYLNANTGTKAGAPGTDPGTSGSRLHARVLEVGSGNVQWRVDELVYRYTGPGGITIMTQSEGGIIGGVEAENPMPPYLRVEGQARSIDVFNFRILQDNGQGWGATPTIDPEANAFEITEAQVNAYGFRASGYIHLTPGNPMPSVPRKVGITGVKSLNITFPTKTIPLQGQDVTRTNVSFNFDLRRDYVAAYGIKGQIQGGYADEIAARADGVGDYDFWLDSNGFVRWADNSID